ncbi:hypothetical protein [Streptomyces yaizuensis]|uniref:Uncharacterized protein n=1 Tax=Streptomyces yaizuensis TaxID=2989713 RepID=A0AA86IXU9_9ACTN|nr:hypothetical protein [Streptomyces sp. YSPA8]BDT39485.1 hypothetical protein SYYSPA8_36835 [Streptomyces sp. YSPA8]
MAPTDDPAPVEKAVADGVVGDYPPETFLWIIFRPPEGGVRIWHAWTDGGHQLGDQVDRMALASGLDAADWLDVTSRHERISRRGRVEIRAYALRPVFGDVQSGVRCLEDRREYLRGLIRTATEMTGRPTLPGIPRWQGVGPALTSRKY